MAVLYEIFTELSHRVNKLRAKKKKIDSLGIIMDIDEFIAVQIDYYEMFN